MVIKHRFGKVIASTCSHYEKSLTEFGDCAKGVNWKDAGSQELRFEVLRGIADLNGERIHDVGCGLAHLEQYLCAAGIKCDYVGSDISSLMIKGALGRSPRSELHVANILEEDAEWMRADYMLTSGLFHVKGSNSNAVWKEFVQAMLSRMTALARKGVAFNMMSSHVDYQSPELFYCAPGEIIEYCLSNLSRRVAFRHDYPLWEYTVYIYK